MVVVMVVVVMVHHDDGRLMRVWRRRRPGGWHRALEALVDAGGALVGGFHAVWLRRWSIE